MVCPDNYFRPPAPHGFAYDTRMQNQLPCLKDDVWKDRVEAYAFPDSSEREKQSCKSQCEHHPHYLVWYDTAKGVPLLSTEIYNSQPVHAVKRLDVDVYKRPGIPFRACSIEPFVRSEMFKYSGYDRGHMVGSFSDSLPNANASCQTFNMCNVAPQSPQLNRVDWLNAEEVFDDHYKRHSDEELVVFSGPLYNTSRKFNKDEKCIKNDKTSAADAADCTTGDVVIPTGFYKMGVAQGKNAAVKYETAQSYAGKNSPTECTQTCEMHSAQPFLKNKKCCDTFAQACTEDKKKDWENSMGLLFPSTAELDCSFFLST